MYKYLTQKLISGDFSYLRNLPYVPDHRYIVDAINFNPLLAIQNIPMDANLIGHALHVYFLSVNHGDDDDVMRDINKLNTMLDFNKQAFINNIEFGVLIAENFVMGTFSPSDILESLCVALCPQEPTWFYLSILDNSDELRCMLENY